MTNSKTLTNNAIAFAIEKVRGWAYAHYDADLHCLAAVLENIPVETLAWCSANREVIEALRAGTWVAVPKEPTEKMTLASWQAFGIYTPKNYPKGEKLMIGCAYQSMLAAAPKKPGGT